MDIPLEYFIYFGLLLIVMTIFGIFLYANFPLQWTIGGEMPCVAYLAETELQLIRKDNINEQLLTESEYIKAAGLFSNTPTLIMAVRCPRCGFCQRQANSLTKVVNKFIDKNIALVGIVRETLGTDELRQYLHGDLYLDKAKRFFGPKERWFPFWMGLLRIQTYSRSYHVNKEGYKVKLSGDGQLLGGVYLLYKDRLLYGHLENGWGDMVDVEKLIKAINQIQ